MWVESKANACNIGTFIKFYIQMRVEKKTKKLPIDSIGHSHNSADWADLSIFNFNPQFFGQSLHGGPYFLLCKNFTGFKRKLKQN